ncbi:DUF2269 family protein [Ureibacillus sp. MALMAid1270]|uniref:DUF2269 family protein n=1 Tax=Ureibacillus sp. MALMAid1270 TaxID=3411629 RepID=UPI003BA7491A
MVSVYSLLVLVHVLSAIIGIGATFLFPVLTTSAKNLTQLKYTLALMKKAENYPKVGGIFLILSGLIMGFLNPTYFTKIWFTGSLVLYVVVEILIYAIANRKMMKVIPVVMAANGEEIPNEYKVVEKTTQPIHMIASLIGIIIIVLMVLKPF